MAVAALDYSNVVIDGKPRKIKMQDVADKIRVIKLPTSGRYRVTIGPVYGTSGITQSTSNVMGYALGATGTYTNNASSPAVVDEAVRGDMAAGENREITFGYVASERPGELALWCDLANGYTEITFDSVEGR